MTRKIELTTYERAVLVAVHDAPYIIPSKQPAEIRAAINFLKSKKLLGQSCLHADGLESTEAGAKLLGYA